MRHVVVLTVLVVASAALALDAPSLEIKLKDGEYFGGFSFSSDRERVAGSKNNEDLRVWSARDGRVLLTVTLPTGLSSAPAFSPDGKSIAAGCMDKTVRVWSLENGKELFAFKGHALYQPLDVAFNSDSSKLASAAWSDGTVRTWDLKSGKQLASFNIDGSWKSVAWTPDGKQLLLAGAGVRLIDAESGKDVLKFPNQATDPVALSPDTTVLASGTMGLLMVASPDGRRVCEAHNEVFVWKTVDGSRVKMLPAKPNEQVQSDALQFSPDGRSLGVIRSSTFQVIDVTTGAEIGSVKAETAGRSFRFAYSSDGKSVLCVTGEGLLKSWKLPAK
jgi:WD40 repeat protein